MNREIEVIFVLLPKVHLIDMAGPVQVFYEARQFGANFNIKYCCLHDDENVLSQQGLTFTNLTSYDHLQLTKNDYLFIPGREFTAIQDG